MNSKRLPGKVLYKIAGKTVLEHILFRLKKSKKINNIYILTSTSKKDDSIFDLAKSKKFKVFRGSEKDVLKRFYDAAKLINADYIVRCNADCPLIDYRILDKMINKFTKNKKYDYLSNILIPTFPTGMHIEIFKKEVLNLANFKCKSKYRREHVTPYIYRNKRLKIINIKNKQDLSFHRWTLDYYEDFIFIRKIYSMLYKKNKYFDMYDIINVIKKNPHLKLINYHIKKNNHII